jgi:cation diffusion facilitator family transporter
MISMVVGIFMSAAHRHQDHFHGSLDPALFATEKGIGAIKWSLLVLLLTALLQGTVVIFTSSVALLADTIHNVGDAATGIPLWMAFLMARKKPTKRFNYGLGRVEDIAGTIIVAVMLLSGVAIGYISFTRLFEPNQIQHLGAVAAASIFGFVGNEVAAAIRIRTGREIGSAALIADGHHARIDGLTSLGVVVGVLGVWLGFPKADPIVGLGITAIVFKMVWDAGKSIFTRLLDGVDPAVLDEVQHAAHHVTDVREVTEVRVRWVGHRLSAEINIAVNSHLSVEQGHRVAQEVRHALLHHLPYLGNATIHVDPVSASGEHHHRILEHRHDELPTHSH